MYLLVIKILFYKKVVSCVWKIVSFFSYVISCDVEILWSVVMLYVLEIFCFIILSYNVKLLLFGLRWFFCGSC